MLPFKNVLDNVLKIILVCVCSHTCVKAREQLGGLPPLHGF